MKRVVLILAAILLAAGMVAAAPAKFAWYIPAPHPYFDTVRVGVEAFEKEYKIQVKKQVGPDWNMDSENTGVLALVAEGYRFFSVYPADASAANGLYDEVVGQGGKVVNFGASTFEPTPASFAVRTDVRSGHIGLPVPGVEVKLVKDASTGDKTEIRFRGPNVMPGYWRAPEQTAEAFDEEGFYRTGDAAKWVDPERPELGLMFDGRTAEDFKLSTGTFVSVGPLRAKITMAGDPCVQDAVITGLNRDDVGALIFPRPDECRKLAGLDDSVPFPEVLHHPGVRGFFQALADRLWRDSTGSANRVARLHVLAEPPAIDKGEITDKGSINQRAVLTHRAALVEALYEGRESDPFLILPNKS